MIEDGPQIVVIEPYREFVRDLAKLPWTIEQFRGGWEPPREEPLPEIDVGNLQAWQLARLSRKLRDNGAYQVLALLLDLLLTVDAVPGRHAAAKYTAGQRWVWITQEQLAKELGVRLVTVNRGMKTLKARDLVLTRKIWRDGKLNTEYCVDFGGIGRLLET